MTEQENLSEIVKRLVEAVNPEEIVLFGSRGRNRHHPGSDYDLLVIQSQPFGPGHSRLREIGRLEAAIGRLPLATDILLYSQDEVIRWKNSPNHVIGRALREGTVLYARH